MCERRVKAQHSGERRLKQKPKRRRKEWRDSWESLVVRSDPFVPTLWRRTGPQLAIRCWPLIALYRFGMCRLRIRPTRCRAESEPHDSVGATRWSRCKLPPPPGLELDHDADDNDCSSIDDVLATVAMVIRPIQVGDWQQQGRKEVEPDSDCGGLASGWLTGG